jgi:N-terminal domain in fatty acid synthase subunit beta
MCMRLSILPFFKWTRRAILKDKFTHNQSQRDTFDTTVQLENEAEATTIELSASFLAYVTESIAEDQLTHAHTSTSTVLNVFNLLQVHSLSTLPAHPQSPSLVFKLFHTHSKHFEPVFNQYTHSHSFFHYLHLFSTLLFVLNPPHSYPSLTTHSDASPTSVNCLSVCLEPHNVFLRVSDN